MVLIHFPDATDPMCMQTAYAMLQECAVLQVGLVIQLFALQELQEQLQRKRWWAFQAEVKAEQEISKLQEQLAAAQASDDAAHQGVKSLEQEVKRLEQELAGSQTATAPGAATGHTGTVWQCVYMLELHNLCALS